MNEEVEIQVVLKNQKEVEKKLEEVAQFVKKKKQIDQYFIPQHEDFFKIDVPLEYLRVRTEDGKDELAYHFLHFDEKGELIKIDEYETGITDPKMMSIILEKMDMTNKVTVTKTRKYFIYKEFEVLIDHIEELGHFIEVEAKDAEGTHAEIKQKCFAVLEELGVEWEKSEIEGYPRMILAKK